MYNGSEDRVQYWQARSQSGKLRNGFHYGITTLALRCTFCNWTLDFSGGRLGRASGTATSHTSTWSSTWIYSPRYIMFNIYRYVSDMGIGESSPLFYRYFPKTAPKDCKKVFLWAIKSFNISTKTPKNYSSFNYYRVSLAWGSSSPFAAKPVTSCTSTR